MVTLRTGGNCKNGLSTKSLRIPSSWLRSSQPDRPSREKFELLTSEADAAIALATPDDLASTAAHTDVKTLRARQNVWVEVGWFWGRLGRNRALLLVRGYVEIPSDLDGIEY